MGDGVIPTYLLSLTQHGAAEEPYHEFRLLALICNHIPYSNLAIVYEIITYLYHWIRITSTKYLRLTRIVLKIKLAAFILPSTPQLE